MSNLYIFPTDTCFWIACPVSDINSYEKIYKIKWRVLDKPLALLCMNYKYLEENTILNKKQIDFIKNYNNPFTILIDLDKIKDRNLLNIIKKLPNSELYKKLAFRITTSFMQRRLIEDNWILFLTSANKSNSPELFDTRQVKKQFENEIKNYEIKVCAHEEFSINSKQKSSDIFEFIWDTIEIKYLRKN
jgi:tRNA A37 threonylcarbamoyladenosine synthetase subunit TsaC/SUA5/YrdC